MDNVLISFLALAMVLWLPIAQMSKWEYTFLNLEYKTNDSSVLNIDAKVEIIRRGLYGLTAVMDFSEPLVDGNTQIELRISYNARYNKNFEKTPYKISQGSLLNFMNGFYKKYLNPSLVGCSNMPEWKHELKTLVGLHGQYHFHKCEVDASKFAKMVAPGFYMIDAIVNRVKEPYFEGIFSINVKVDSLLG